MMAFRSIGLLVKLSSRTVQIKSQNVLLKSEF